MISRLNKIEKHKNHEREFVKLYLLNYINYLQFEILQVFAFSLVLDSYLKLLISKCPDLFNRSESKDSTGHYAICIT